jgi:thiopeptide-type bacteriocin biosynthesis protein
VLLDLVQPLVDEVVGRGDVESWFFLRYADPHPHLRVRFRGDPQRLAAAVLPALHRHAEALLADGRLWRTQLDTYVREVERYGGGGGIELCEELFRIDSEAVLAILASVPGDEGLTWRWKLTLAAIDQLIQGLVPADERLGHVRRCRDAYVAELDPTGSLRPALGRTWRAERAGISELLDLIAAPGPSPYPAVAALQRRAAESAHLLGELGRRAAAGLLTEPLPGIAQSLCHLHAIRLLRSAPRLQELVVYDLLDRTYRARRARA